MAVRIRFSDTEYAVPSSWAKSDTRNSSSIHFTEANSGGVLMPGISMSNAVSYSSSRPWMLKVAALSRVTLPAFSFSRRVSMAEM